ncbi:hypothetical protein BDR22DRAFT_429739 [Usnea florida]
MAMAEDAASVLEQFVQDVANLPAEIAHLLEEIQAKDRVVQECRNVIATRDGSIQKFLKLNGAGQPNPKEEGYCKNVMANFDKAQIVQEEKVGLSEKAALLLDRQIKRLDFKIRDLQNEGAIQPDPQLPSLLNNSTLSTRLPPLSSTATGGPTPLHPLSGNAAGPSTTIANNPISRLVQPSASARQPSPLQTTAPATHLNQARNAHRSPSTDPSKRRRLNPHHLSIPATSSSLRQSSLGPGTPKADLAASRGSSAGPTRPVNKKPANGRTGAPPHQRIGHLNPAATKKSNTAGSRRRGNQHNKKSGTPLSTTGDDDSVVGDENDEDVEMEEGDDEGEGDDKKYCVCHSVSYGNMVACDNDDCPNEWFHWSCVGVTKEPVGKWYCPDCRRGRP